WAWTQQQAYRDLVVNPEWRDEVRDALPEALIGAFDRNFAAGATLRELTSPRDTLPDWRIVEPPPAEELLGHYEAAEAEFGVGWEYLAAIHLVETRMGRIRGVSTAGARGPMQFMPATWDAYGTGDIDDPGDAIRAAARYLTASGAPEDMRSALFAYNRSDHYVDAITAHAEVMADDERAYLAYHHWQVHYRLDTGDVVLPVGWERE
ncbi:MAG: lytic transglycosylase domain-containing protein, partial [Nitriliruptoraceae bacterium]